MILKYLANPSMLLKIIILCGASFCAFSSAQAQELKIGYVNSQRIFKEALPFKAAAAKLNQDFGKRDADLQDMKKNLYALQAKYDKDGPVMSETDRIKAQRELAELNKEIQRKGRELQEDLSQRQNEERDSLSDRVLKVIKQIAKDEKYDLVLQDAPYYSERVDITDKVLNELNKQ
jgi:outer membrane protein